MAQTKVLVCFISGLLYIAVFVGFLRGRAPWILGGVLGAILFLGLYFVELAAWGRSHLRVWLHFSIFGGLSSLCLIWCWRHGRSALPW